MLQVDATGGNAMKVVKISNFNLENFPESQASFDGLTKKEAMDIAEELNRTHSGPDSPIYFNVVEDDYVLCDGEP